MFLDKRQKNGMGETVNSNDFHVQTVDTESFSPWLPQVVTVFTKGN